MALRYNGLQPWSSGLCSYGDDCSICKISNSKFTGPEQRNFSLSSKYRDFCVRGVLPNDSERIDSDHNVLQLVTSGHSAVQAAMVYGALLAFTARTTPRYIRQTLVSLRRLECL
jgi:hypothetical protein